jgi:5'-nucleotidase
MIFRRLLPLLLVATAAVLSLAAYPGAQEPTSYRILVTNDDGIDTPGLIALVKAMSNLGEVVVTAPDGNRSGASQSSKVFSETMIATPREIPGAKEAWALSGTPSDCAAYGLVALSGERGFDLVVSGINRGSNVGEVAHYSGTVGAALEGGMRGIPSIAVSEESRIKDHSVSAEFAARFAKKLLEEGGTPGVVYNINVPSAKPEGVKVAPMGGLYLGIEGFSREDQEDGGFHARAQIKWNQEAPEGSDTAAYRANFISIAPLRVDWTAHDLLKRVDAWGVK